MGALMDRVVHRDDYVSWAVTFKVSLGVSISTHKLLFHNITRLSRF